MLSRNRRKILPSPHPCADDVGVLVYHVHNEASEKCSGTNDKPFKNLMSWLYTGDYQPKYECFSCENVLQGDVVRYRCVTCQYDVIFDQCELCRRDGLDHDNCHEFMAYYCQSSTHMQQTNNKDGDAVLDRIKQLIELGILDVFDDKEGSILNRIEKISHISSLILVMMLHSDENEFALLTNQLVNLLPSFLKDNNTKYFSSELVECFYLILQKQPPRITEELGCLLLNVCIAIVDRLLSDSENQALDDSTKRVLCSILKLVHHLLLKQPFGVSSFEEQDNTRLKQSIMRVLTIRQFTRANVEVEFHLLCIGSYLDTLEEPSFLLTTSLRRVMGHLICQSRYPCCGYLLGLFKSKHQLKQLNCEALILELLKKTPSTQQEFKTRLDETASIFNILGGFISASLESNPKLQNKIKDTARTVRNWLSESSSLSTEFEKTGQKIDAKKKDFLNLNDDIPSPVPKPSNGMKTLIKSNQEENEDWFESMCCASKPNELVNKNKENRAMASTSSNASKRNEDENDIPWSIMLKNRAKHVVQPNKVKTKGKDVSNQSFITTDKQQQQLNFKAKVEFDSFVMFPLLETVSTERLKQTSFSQFHEQSPRASSETCLLNLIEEILSR